MKISQIRYVRFTRYRRRELSPTDMEEKNFSGHKWTGSEGMRRMRKLAGTAECNGSREKEREGRETGRVRKWAGYELLRQRVYEVPVDRMPSKGGHVAPSRKGKSVILPCVTRITKVKSDPDILSRQR